MKFSKKSVDLFLCSLFCMVLASIIYGFLPKEVEGLKIAIIIQFIIFVILFIKLGMANKSYITLYSIFMVLFYVFQNGQLLLYGMGVEYNYFYVEKFNSEVVLDSVKFSLNSMCMAFAAGVYSFRSKTTFRFERRLNKMSENDIFEIARIGIIGTGIIAYILLVLKFLVFLSGNYTAVTMFERTIPSILGVVELFFPAFSILGIISGKCRKKSVKAITGIYLLWGVITALMGDRTTGLGVLVSIAFMYFKNVYAKKNDTRKYKWKRNLFFICITIAVMYLLVFVFSFRGGHDFVMSTPLQVVVDVIGELGFSFFPLVGMMTICPETRPFLYGKSMFSSVISGFIPSSIDLLGLFSAFSTAASLPAKYIAERFVYGFGMDCSMNAECYANFGEFGYIAMYIVCSVVAMMLSNIDYSCRDNIFSQYMGIALLFSWFTLPRRRSYYIYNRIFWYVLIMTLFIFIMKSLLKKK